jgi:hypothetical protein
MASLCGRRTGLVKIKKHLKKIWKVNKYRNSEEWVNTPRIRRLNR